MSVTRTYRKRFFRKGELSRIVVLGAGQLTATAAEFASAHRLECIVFTGPRQREVEFLDGGLVRERLSELGVELCIVEDIRTCETGPYRLGGHGALLLSFGSPYIIRQDLIDAFGGRAINSHGAPLPEWRGGGGFSWRILASERCGNTCFHLVSPEIDAGDIVFQRSYTFPPDVRTPRDHMAYATKEARTGLNELLEGMAEGREFELSPQEAADATYFPRLNAARQGWIDWSWPGDAIARFVLAFSHPYEGAKTLAHGARVTVFDCTFEPAPVHQHPFFNGLVFRIHDGRLFVACEGGSLAIASDHVAADRVLTLGDRLYTPRHLLEDATQLRPVYTPAGLRVG